MHKVHVQNTRNGGPGRLTRIASGSHDSDSQGATEDYLAVAGEGHLAVEKDTLPVPVAPLPVALLYACLYPLCLAPVLQHTEWHPRLLTLCPAAY